VRFLLDSRIPTAKGDRKTNLSKKDKSEWCFLPAGKCSRGRGIVGLHTQTAAVEGRFWHEKGNVATRRAERKNFTRAERRGKNRLWRLC